MRMRIFFALLILATLLIAGEKRNPQTFKMTVTVVYNGVTLDQAARIEAAIKGLVADTAKVKIHFGEPITTSKTDGLKLWPFGGTYTPTSILPQRTWEYSDFQEDTTIYQDVSSDTTWLRGYELPNAIIGN